MCGPGAFDLDSAAWALTNADIVLVAAGMFDENSAPVFSAAYAISKRPVIIETFLSRLDTWQRAVRPLLAEDVTVYVAPMPFQSCVLLPDDATLTEVLTPHFWAGPEATQ